MEWIHEVSLTWMKMRQHFLTASEVKQLIPLTKTGRKRTVTDLDRMKVYSNKIRHLTKADCISTGAAARGHLLEPYAIEAYNNATGDKMYWWDDTLIPRVNKSNHLAFSPDAMSTESKENILDTIEKTTCIGEVKCYGNDRHLITASTPKMELEERWQIATAMACSNFIIEANLILFNPSMRNGYKLFVHRYSRFDLEEEIKMVRKVEEDWIKFISSVDSNNIIRSIPLLCNVEESDIIDKIRYTKALNP